MKTLSLLKAVLSQDMNFFRFSTKNNDSKIKKIIFPIILFLIFGISIGMYAYLLAEKLAPIKLTYIMLTMFIAVIVIITFMEGIYKSQGILFEAKDNDLLFSLPIKKSKILFMRIFKLLLFQYIYNLMFILPALIIYIYFEKPSLSFYFISFLMTILIPIIPTVFSSAIGYIVKLLASKSNSSKIVQTILSSIIFLGIFFLSTNLESFIENIVTQATSINDLLTKIYYPLGLYINLITNFKFFDLLKFIIINIIPLIIFIFLGSKYYFKIIFNTHDTIKSKRKTTKDLYIKSSKIKALTKKEIKRYFSSPVYMFNTSFGLLLILVISIILVFKSQIVFDMLLNSYGVSKDISISLVYYFLIFFATSMTSITSSCISLEGKTINITRSLPIKEKDILLSKLIYPFVIELPFLLVSELIFFIKFKPSIFYIITIILIGLVTILLSGLIGLIVNLKYPKMNALNDTEVVKQSMSSMISVFTGMGIFILSIIGIVFTYEKIKIEILVIIHILILLLISLILYNILMKKGIKDYQKINV